MNEQMAIDFTTTSPINVEKLSGQNRRLYDYLAVKGNTIHCFHDKRRELGIGYLNSRISDLIKAGVKVYKKRIKVDDVNKLPTDVIEYSMYPFQIEGDERQ